MVSMNDMVEETWHDINITVNWITQFKGCVAKFEQNHVPPQNEQKHDHHGHQLQEDSHQDNIESTASGVSFYRSWSVEATSVNSLRTTDFSKLLKAECKIAFSEYT